MGKQFVLKFANRRSANSWAHSVITNPHISHVCQFASRKSANFMINPQIAYLQTITKY